MIKIKFSIYLISAFTLPLFCFGMENSMQVFNKSIKVRSIKVDHSYTKVRSLSYSPDGSIVACIFESPQINFLRPVNKTLEIWDIKNEDLIFSKKDIGNHAIFSFDGKLIAYQEYQNRIQVLNLKTKEIKFTTERLSNFLGPHYIYSIAFSPDGSMLAVGYWNEPKEAVKIYYLNNGEYKRFEIDAPKQITFDSTGNYLYVTSGFMTSEHIDYSLVNRKIRKLDISLDQNFIVECSRHYDCHFLAMSPECIFSLAVNLDGAILKEVSTGNIIAEWNLKNIKKAVFSKNNKNIALIFNDGMVKIYNIASKENIFTIDENIYEIAFDFDGRHIITGFNDKEISEWFLPSKKFIKDLIKGRREITGKYKS